MVLLQPKLNLRVSQKQILTPGLVQMVSVLALNKIELKDMINAEMMENPVLEELDSQVPLIDEIGGKEAQRDRDTAASEEPPATVGEKEDPFEQIDFGSFFKDYLDPGYRSPESEFVEEPSFENFVSKPTSLTEHLMWQLGAAHVRPEVYRAAELVIGNLNEDGYLIASDDELMAVARGERLKEAEDPTPVVEVDEFEHGLASHDATTEENLGRAEIGVPSNGESAAASTEAVLQSAVAKPLSVVEAAPAWEDSNITETAAATAIAKVFTIPKRADAPAEDAAPTAPPFALEDLKEAIELVRQMDPIGVAARDLRECLLLQLEYLSANGNGKRNGNGSADEVAQTIQDAARIVDAHLKQVQNKQFKEIARALGRPVEAITVAMDLVRSLDPRPGLRYNKVEPRLIEPDVAFVKHGDEFIVVMNDEDVPQLRLNPMYRKLLQREASDKEVRGYVKERYKSAIQLIKNIEQRKQTILKVCYAILGRQRDFLDAGIDQMKPMMIKEVAEEIGVHPSTVSRAVANKYAHTPQGVFELRYFFSESVNGPEGGNTSLLILKRRVKKLIEEEDATKPLTDEQITRLLQSQGIQVTRRTVAKYREDMGIPSTHQRRIKA
jgi:RNA polymerase sigma-54 factor